VRASGIASTLSSYYGKVILPLRRLLPKYGSSHTILRKAANPNGKVVSEGARPC